MTRTSIYLRADLAETARKLKLNLSKLCQDAIKAELKRRVDASVIAIDRAYKDRMPTW